MLGALQLPIGIKNRILQLQLCIRREQHVQQQNSIEETQSVELQEVSVSDMSRSPAGAN